MNKVFILQLDGVAGSMLDYAFAHHLMPFTKRLLSRGWRKEDFYCGLPSTTPASQIGLVYGLDDLIPGFRFVMKEEKLTFSPLDSTAQPTLENIAMNRNPHPLTLGGTTVLTIFSGGAEQSVSFNAMYTKKKVWLFILTFFRNPLRTFTFFIKILIYLIIEHKGYKVSHDPRFPHTKKRRFLDVVNGLVEQLLDGELGLYFSRKAIKEGKRAIYVDFTGHDELSHTYGPYSKVALYYLSLQDLFVKGCFDAIQKSKEPYELIILSDHGQVMTMPYVEKFGQNLSEAIAKIYPDRSVFSAEVAPYEKIKGYDLVILNSGGLSLVYEMQNKKKLTLIEFEKKYPKFAVNVSMLQGVGFVLVREGTVGKVYMQGKKYDLTLKDAELFLPGVSEHIRRHSLPQLQKLLDMKYGADVYIVAPTNADPYIGFELQGGSHGAIGGAQTNSFIMSNRLKIDGSAVNDYADIYRAIYSFMNGDSAKNSPAKANG